MNDPEVLKIILPAIIGAAGAIVVFVIKDLVLFEFRESRNRKQQILDRRLSQLYGPILVAMKGGEGMLTNIFVEEIIFGKFMSNMHLLSPELQRIAHEYMKLGKDVRVNDMKLSEQTKAIELSKEFNKILKREFIVLQEQFNGGFWRMRLISHWLTRNSTRTSQKRGAG